MNKLLFLSFGTIAFDAVFENLFAKLFLLTNSNEVCNFNDKKSE